MIKIFNDFDGCKENSPYNTENNFCLMNLNCNKCNQIFKLCTVYSSNKYQLFNDIDIKRHERLNTHKKNVSDKHHKRKDIGIVVDVKF